jgi:hypothetical protein
LQICPDLGDQAFARAKHVFQWRRPDLGAHGDLDLVDQALGQLLRVIGRVAPFGIESEVQQRRRASRIGDPIGDLTLDGDILIVGGHLFEHEGFVHAGGRDQHQRTGRREIEHRKACALAQRAAIAELDHVVGGLGLDETQTEHRILLCQSS